MQMKKILKTFNQNIVEVRNTIPADVNEIMFAYFAAGEDWGLVGNDDIVASLQKRKEQLTAEQFDEQVGRASAMYETTATWASSNGWEGNITKVWWTARPGVLTQAVGGKVSPGNPTDVLLEYEGEDYLGISAKSTKGKGEIGFKNPGIGSIAAALGIDLNSVVKEITAQAVEDLKLPKTMKARKMFIRAIGNEEIKAQAENIGLQVLTTLRQNTFQFLSGADEEVIRQHLVDYWLDAGSNYPYYIKVTGRGTPAKGYSASITDPTKNEKYKALMSEPISVIPVGTHSIGIKAGDQRVMKMRFKYESQKLASSLKMSGDPW